MTSTSLTEQILVSTYHELAPWDENDPSPPRTFAFQQHGDSLSLAEYLPGADTQASYATEVRLEITEGVLQVLIYHPDHDTPLSVRVLPKGYLVGAHDTIQDGAEVFCDHPIPVLPST